MAREDKLTKRSVEAAAEDSARDYWIRDTELPGFRLRVRRTGRRTYEVRYRFKGRDRLYVIGDHGAPWTADDARTRATSVLRQVDLGEDPYSEKVASRARAITVAELIERYLVEAVADKPQKRANSWATDRSNFAAHVIPLLGKVAVEDLTPSALSKWQKDVADGKTATTRKTGKKRGRSTVKGGKGAAARAMRSLSGMLSWAVFPIGLITENPAKNVPKLADAHREKFLSADEAADLWDTLDKMEGAKTLRGDFADFFRLIALTGARRAEILDLQWREVDLSRGILTLPPNRHKAGGGGRDRVIHLHTAAIEILRLRQRAVLKRNAELKKVIPWVFPKADGSTAMEPPKRAWAAVRKAAGLPTLRLHDLRHTYASFLIAEGTPLAIVGKALGHAKASSTERYAHLRDEATRHAAAHVGEIYRPKSVAEINPSKTVVS